MKKVLKVLWNLFKSLFYALCIAGIVGLLTWGNILVLANWGPYWYLGYLGVAAITFFIAMCLVDQTGSQKGTDKVHEVHIEGVDGTNKYKESLKVLEELNEQLAELESKRAKMNKK